MCSRTNPIMHRNEWCGSFLSLPFAAPPPHGSPLPSPRSPVQYLGKLLKGYPTGQSRLGKPSSPRTTGAVVILILNRFQSSCFSAHVGLTLSPRKSVVIEPLSPFREAPPSPPSPSTFPSGPPLIRQQPQRASPRRIPAKTASHP